MTSAVNGTPGDPLLRAVGDILRARLGDAAAAQQAVGRALIEVQRAVQDARDLKPIQNLIEVAPAAVNVTVDMDAVAAALDRLAGQLGDAVREMREQAVQDRQQFVAALALLVKALREQPAIKVEPVINVKPPVVNVEAPVVNVHVPEQGGRVLKIRHDDGTESTITEE